jgi:tetratricopeptide (TPR) repeat protein
MRRSVALMLFTCLASLAGCGTTGSNDVSTPEQPKPQAAPAVGVPDPGLSARERLRKAIALLEVGAAEQARVELGAYLKEVPNSKLADSLIQQIETDPTQLLGSTSYAYTLRPGESLSMVAKRALGDAMLFHALARYNGITNPSALRAGQTIRVPGNAPPAPNEPEPAAAAEPVKSATEYTAKPRLPQSRASRAPQIESEVQRLQDLMLTAQGLSSQSNFRGAAALYEEGAIEFPDNANLKQLAAANYVNYANQLSNAGQPEKAIDSLRRAAELVPGNSSLKQRLAGAQRQAQAKVLYDEGLGLYSKDKLADAYDKFSEAAALNPEHLGAREKMAEIAPKVAARWHREALIHFRHQDLKTAVALWDKVLKIDPTNIQAQVYRAQAKELDDRLRALQRR